ncbi:unnamed protein product [Colias eurytheme]|nr:unnamed protein product [Colias eurytheme]
MCSTVERGRLRRERALAAAGLRRAARSVRQCCADCPRGNMFRPWLATLLAALLACTAADRSLQPYCTQRCQQLPCQRTHFPASKSPYGSGSFL